MSKCKACMLMYTVRFTFSRAMLLFDPLVGSDTCFYLHIDNGTLLSRT